MINVIIKGEKMLNIYKIWYLTRTQYVTWPTPYLIIYDIVEHFFFLKYVHH